MDQFLSRRNSRRRMLSWTQSSNVFLFWNDKLPETRWTELWCVGLPWLQGNSLESEKLRVSASETFVFHKHEISRNINSKPENSLHTSRNKSGILPKPSIWELPMILSDYSSSTKFNFGFQGEPIMIIIVLSLSGIKFEGSPLGNHTRNRMCGLSTVWAQCVSRWGIQNSALLIVLRAAGHEHY